ncbi:MAG: helix-turn-helix domain-containing protein [Caldisericaceae bacterium]
MDIREFFVLKLKEALKEHDITQKDLAKTTGLSSSYISQLLQGKKTPTIKVVSKIAHALNLPTSYFLEENNVKVLFHLDKDLTEEDILAIEAFVDYLKKKKNASNKAN